MAARHALPTDYDDNPRRFRLARDVARRHGLASDVHADVARRVLAAGLVPLLDVGCGDGWVATAARATELGGRVIAPHWVRTTVIADPQGATFIASEFVPENKDLGSGTDAAAGAGIV